MIDAVALPIDRDVMRWFEQHRADPAVAAVCGGDDYELMFTVRPAHRGRLRAVKRLLGDLPITRIGVVTKDREVVMRTAAGDKPVPRGFDHFIK